MPYLSFLWLDGIRGPSQDPRHLGEIDVRSYSYDVASGQQVSSGFSEVTIGAQRPHLHIMKLIDASSPELFGACAFGKRFPTAILSLERSFGGRSSGEVAKIVMRGMRISSIRPVGPAAKDNESPVEEMSMEYESLSWQYKEPEK